MVRRARTALWLVRGVSALSILAFLGLALVEALKLWRRPTPPSSGHTCSSPGQAARPPSRSARMCST